MQIIHQSAYYIACNHPKAGLIVQKAGKTDGVNMRPDHPQYADYVEAIITAIDKKEADALCRALFN